MLSGNHIMNMNGKILPDELNGKPFYLSLNQGKRYYPKALGFEGSDEEFIKACVECPPDSERSYTEVSKKWKPTWCKMYQGNEFFRKEITKMVAEKCRKENLSCRFEKDIA